MRVVVHHSKYYDWEPVPPGTEVTPKHIALGLVKPNDTGDGYLMSVTKEPEGGTHTTVFLSERQIVAKIIDEKTRPSGGRTWSRKEAVAGYLSEHLFAVRGRGARLHAHPNWITKIEVHDDGHDESIMRKALDEHVEAGNIQADHLEPHVSAYTESATSDDHAAHLAAHFKIKAVA